MQFRNPTKNILSEALLTNPVPIAYHIWFDDPSLCARISEKIPDVPVVRKLGEAKGTLKGYVIAILLGPERW